MEEETNSFENFLDAVNMQIRNLEEKQKILKSRVLLIGENLIESREKTNEKFNEIKKSLDLMKEDMEKMKSLIKDISESLPEFARKEDLDIIAKQIKMFEPLKYLKEGN